MPDEDETVDELAASLLEEISLWYETKRHNNGNVNTNVMSVGLAMTEHMTMDYPLEESDYLTNSQVKNLSGTRISNILKSHGELRPFRREGGRTSRGTIKNAKELASVLNCTPLRERLLDLESETRSQIASKIQRWFVQRIKDDFFDRQFIEAEIDPRKPICESVSAILTVARQRGGNTAGAVAQHLIGATLSLRFPKIEISNDSYTTADQQTSRSGDFQVGDTAFHITMSPSDQLLQKRCKSNLHDGYRSTVLVPSDRISAANQLADIAGITGQVSIVEIEDFVGTKIEEISNYESLSIRENLRSLLVRYNERVQAVEPDPSLQLSIPSNL